MFDLAEVSQLDQFIDCLWKVRLEATDDPTYGFDDPWPLFMRKMMFLTSQSYGSRIQNRIIEIQGWEKVKAKLNLGDAKTPLGEYYEIKCGIIMPYARSLHVVQIRPWQKVTGYRIFAIVPEENYAIYQFHLSKPQMKEEIHRIGASAHGTEDAVKNNPNKEWRFTIPWDPSNEDFRRWRQIYFANLVPVAEEK